MENTNKRTYKCSKVNTKCKYAGRFTGTGPYLTYCDYLNRAGYRRGCPAEECDKYEPKNGRYVNKPYYHSAN